MSKQPTHPTTSTPHLLPILGVTLMLYGICWLLPIIKYLTFLRHDFPHYPPIIQAHFAQFLHLPQIHTIQAIVFISPLPLLVFGLGCLFAREWARRAAIAFLVLQLLALLYLILLLVHGIRTPYLAFQITTQHGYFAAAATLFINGFLCEFLLRARAVNRK